MSDVIWMYDYIMSMYGHSLIDYGLNVDDITPYVSLKGGSHTCDQDVGPTFMPIYEDP